MIMEYLFAAFGFALLIKGADWLVESAKKIAFSLGISAFIVGMSVVALGTSLPETMIGVISGVTGTNELSLGDVVGSCIANIALILGVGAVIMPLKMEAKAFRVDIPISFFMQAVLLLMALTAAVLTRVHGAILLALFLLYCVYIFLSARRESAESRDAADKNEQKTERADVKTYMLLLLGLAGLIFGAKLVVDNATVIARQFGMSEELVGVTVVALGTSLPELITTIVAAVKKHSDIAIGNIIGSNILNICLVLGLTVTIHPIAIRPGLTVDSTVMAGVTATLFLAAIRRKRLGRPAGILLLAIYAGFIAYSVYCALSGTARD
jgi:cation:H+ antiporter